MGRQRTNTSTGLWFLILLLSDRSGMGRDVEKDQRFLFVLEMLLLFLCPSVTAPRCWPLKVYNQQRVFPSLRVAGRDVTDWSPLKEPPSLGQGSRVRPVHPRRDSYEGPPTCGITDLIIVKSCNSKRDPRLAWFADNLG